MRLVGMRSGADRSTIESYRPGGFRVSGRYYRGSLLVYPGHVESWEIGAGEEVLLRHLEPVREHRPRADLLLLGMGVAAPLPSPELLAGLRGWGIPVEWMNTPAACRTFNLLLGEGREVVAALLALPEEEPERR